MSIESNSHTNESLNRDSILENQLSPEDGDRNDKNFLSVTGNKEQDIDEVLAVLQSEENRIKLGKASQYKVSNKANSDEANSDNSNYVYKNGSSLNILQPKATIIALLAIAVTIIGISLDNSFIGALGVLVSLFLSGTILIPWFKVVLSEWLTPQQRSLTIALVGLTIAVIAIVRFSDVPINWDASGTLAEWFGALGQILIAIIAVYVAWRQYVISKNLTIQQNLLTVQQNNLTIQQNSITQQQTIDSYFQGISDLVLDDEGLLEDWPQERLLAEGRTAAILGSVDAQGKAKIIRFLSQSKLLTPLKRDSHLGRAIFDGKGGYAEDRYYGVRVIDLGVMLAGADLSRNDLRWTDLSDANLVRANLSDCDLVKANLARCILYEANLSDSDLNSTRFFYGTAENASPRSRDCPPNYKTGEYTGAVVQNVDFSNVKRMPERVKHYCCAWCGEKSRATIPGGCEGIPNKLEEGIGDA